MKLRKSTAVRRFPDAGDHFTRGNPEGRQQRLGAMPDVLVGPGAGLFCPQRQTWLRSVSLTFALNGHFRRQSRRILFAINGGSAETAQVKTLPLF
jgi:hypothetical protein